MLHATYRRYAQGIGLIGATYVWLSLMLVLGIGVMIVQMARAGASYEAMAQSHSLSGFLELAFGMLGVAALLMIVGLSLSRTKPWSRKLAFIPAAALLLLFPIGTFVGIAAGALLASRGAAVVFSDAYRSQAPADRSRVATSVIWLLGALLALTCAILAALRASAS